MYKLLSDWFLEQTPSDPGLITAALHTVAGEKIILLLAKLTLKRVNAISSTESFVLGRGRLNADISRISLIQSRNSLTAAAVASLNWVGGLSQYTDTSPAAASAADWSSGDDFIFSFLTCSHVFSIQGSEGCS